MTKENQVPADIEELQKYLGALVTGKLEEDESVRKIGDKPATVEQVTMIMNYLGQAQDQTNTKIIDVLQIQQRVLDKLGATEEMMEEAREEYNGHIEDVANAMRAQADEEESSEESK